MRRKPGRPPLDAADATVKLTVSVTTRKYDALYARAIAARLTLSEYVRRELRAVPSSARSNPIQK